MNNGVRENKCFVCFDLRMGLSKWHCGNFVDNVCETAGLSTEGDVDMFSTHKIHSVSRLFSTLMHTVHNGVHKMYQHIILHCFILIIGVFYSGDVPKCYTHCVSAVISGVA